MRIIRCMVLIPLLLLSIGCTESGDIFDLPENERIEATVTNIVDGDTFDVHIDGYGEDRVRPILVDAPEICHQHSPPECEPEPFGEEATILAEEVLLDKTVYLEQDASERDQYDRLLFYVYLENGQMFQEILLENGLAEVVVFPPDIKYKDAFYEIESLAKENKVGMWAKE